MNDKNEEFAALDTDIEEVKRKNADSGLSYKEVLEVLARTGGHGTAAYSDTDIEQVKRNNHSNK
jgi:hypothetical protein